MEKKLMLGNEAVARGALEAGVMVVSSYPGTPSTEITEYISKYDGIYSEWAPNEKVAMEVAIGAAIGGARALCAMKHVGLNVAADPLFTAAYTGVNAGLVACVADDPGMHSSQNEQDTRNYAIGAKVPLLEPSDSHECKEFLKLAYTISEEYDTPVILRLSTRVSHSQSLVTLQEPEKACAKDYVKNPSKYVMMPAMARGRHIFVEERMKKLLDFAEKTEINTVIPAENTNQTNTTTPSDPTEGKKIGIITSGIAYQYAREAFREQASYLKLGLINPLPTKMLQDFVQSVDLCFVVEELDPVIEKHCKSLGLKVIGKEIFTLLGEYSTELVRETILSYFGSNDKAQSTTQSTVQPSSDEAEPVLPGRPPVMCAGCPHRGVFFTLKQMNIRVSGDIGCYTLGALPPFTAMDACVCMGASISMAHGMEKAGLSDTVAVIGDSTFIHSGITGLIDMVYNKGTGTVLILDNSITGMTGHQENPTTGRTIKGEPTKQVNLALLCEAVGVSKDRIRIVDPFQVDSLKSVIKEELAAKEPSVIITQRPCALLKSVKREAPYVIAESCKACGLCTKGGCPAIAKSEDKKAKINPALCIGCGYCVNLCKFGVIKR